MSASLKTSGVVALALTAAACGGGSRTLAFDDLGPEIIAASCRVNTMCGESPDQTTCVASTQIQTSLFETLRADIDSGTVKYDGHAARTCVDEYASLQACTYTELFRLQVLLDASCGKVFTGTLAPGSACYSNEECANQGTCDRLACTDPSSCCAGTCLARPTIIPVGGDCSQANTDCVTGTRCTANLQSASGLSCEPALEAGAACSTTSDACAFPYGCVASDGTSTTGTCTAPPATGEACGTTTANLLCNDVRDECDASALVCVRKISVGGACATSTVGCAGSAICDGTTCVARGGPGAACDLAVLQPCLGTLECDSTQHCALPPKGGSCR